MRDVWGRGAAIAPQLEMSGGKVEVFWKIWSRVELAA